MSLVYWNVCQTWRSRGLLLLLMWDVCNGTLLAWLVLSPDYYLILQFSSAQLLSHVRLFATPWTAAPQASLSITNSWSLLNLMSIESVMPSNHLILCRPLLLLLSGFPSIRVFSSELGLCIRWSKYWSFSISPSSEYSGLISFRIDWFDLRALRDLLGLSRVFFSTTIRKHRFFGTQPSLSWNSHIHTWQLEKPKLWLYEPLSAKWCLCFLIHCLGLS